MANNKFPNCGIVTDKMKNKLIRVVASILICTAAVMADTFPNTLWIGNGGLPAAPILNTTTTGVEVRRIDSMQAHGLAIDSNKLYVNATLSGGPAYNLDTLAINGSFTLPNPGFDMTFSGGFIWSTDLFFNAIDKVNPVTGDLEGGFSVGFSPIGLTTDGGAGFWVSGSDNFGGPVLQHFDGNGNLLDNIDPAHLAVFVNFGIGGLGFDPRDGTLFIGSFGRVYQFSTAGAELDHFDLLDPNQFVDGLEFAPATALPAPVPEPTSIVLLGTVVLAVAGIHRRLRIRCTTP